jgi:hypothetical protein
MSTSDNAAGNVAGTTAAGAWNGLNSYVSANAPGVTLASQGSDPTVGALAGDLTAHSAVQLGILWGTISSGTFTAEDGGGGHFVSLTGITWNGTSGTMSILDPWGPVSSSSSSGTTAAAVTLTISGEVSLGSSTVLLVTYPGQSLSSTRVYDTTTPDGTDPTSYGSTHYFYGYIAVDDVESVSAVPEPTTISLLLLPFGAGMLRMLRRNRTA